MDSYGAFFFGAVMGWLTYFTIRYKKDHGISDLSAVIGALGGGAVLHLFSKESGMFSLYEIGLAAGFFGYVVILLLIALCTHKAADLVDGTKSNNPFMNG